MGTRESLTVVDNRTGKSYEIPIADGAIRAMDLRQIKSGAEDFGLLAYDPAFTNTASTRSTITFIDGDKGLLWYRGYPIEQLAEKTSFLEVAYLLLRGELPTARALEEFTWEITHHTWVHENVKKFMDGFHHDAHPMGMLISTVAALSTFRSTASSRRCRRSRRSRTATSSARRTRIPTTTSRTSATSSTCSSRPPS